MTAQPEFTFEELSRERPREIVTETSAEFMALCRRADMGEIIIERVSVGDGPAQWRVGVIYLTNDIE